MKTGNKCESRKTVQILGHAVSTPIAKGSPSACGYNVQIKDSPTYSPKSQPSKQETFPWQSNLLNPNFSPYLPVYKKLLQGMGVKGTLDPQSMRHMHPLPSSPAFPSQELLKRPHSISHLWANRTGVDIPACYISLGVEVSFTLL